MSPNPVDPYEWMQLPQTRRAAERARREVRRRGTAAVREDARIATLESALERSMAMNLALWELVADKLELGSDALEAKLQELELRGPSAGPAAEPCACVACGRQNRAERVRCFYCGEFVAERQDSEFRADLGASEPEPEEKDAEAQSDGASETAAGKDEDKSSGSK